MNIILRVTVMLRAGVTLLFPTQTWRSGFLVFGTVLIVMHEIALLM